MAEMEEFFFGAAGDDGDSGKMARGPLDFLWFGPSSVRTAGEDDRVQVSDRLIELHGVGHEQEGPVKVAVVADSLPEEIGAESGFGVA